MENKQTVIAVFDIGKTNKKLFLFNEAYEIVFERTAKFTETTDEDGFPCDNLSSLVQSARDTLKEVIAMPEFEVKAINFTTYGASFVYVDEAGNPLTPLYNYLKEFPEPLSNRFFNDYGGRDVISVKTASPVLGSLNSGMQLYRLKHEKPELYRKTKFALHLPQYMSFLFTGKAYADLTSIGCHTMLWDYHKHEYHDWVKAERITDKLPEIWPGDKAIPLQDVNDGMVAGIGLHDSSSALIPYLVCFREPFALISSGTWCITLNPFNSNPLTEAELKQDCLCFLTYTGQPVKASRIFSGNEHEQQTKRLAAHFNCNVTAYQQLKYDPAIIGKLGTELGELATKQADGLKSSPFAHRDLAGFGSYTEAYHRLIMDLVDVQIEASGLVLNGTGVKRVFVDGGFSRNPIFMNLMAAALPGYELYAASVPQATSLGAALAIHSCWNSNEIPSNLIELKYFAAPQVNEGL